MRWGVIIAAAGHGTRFGRPKQLIEIAGAPLVSWCMRTFARIPEIAEVVVVTERETVETLQELAGTIFSVPARVVPGGAIRQESVSRGLAALSPSCEAVFVHDGARPLVSETDIRAGMSEVRSGCAAVLATPCTDTIKIVDPQTHIIEKTLDRERLWAAQTPQFATVADLRRAHESAAEKNVTATDESALLEDVGVTVVVVQTSSPNLKVTHPDDLAIVEKVLLEGSVAR